MTPLCLLSETIAVVVEHAAAGGRVGGLASAGKACPGGAGVGAGEVEQLLLGSRGKIGGDMGTPLRTSSKVIRFFKEIGSGCRSVGYPMSSLRSRPARPAEVQAIAEGKVEQLPSPAGRGPLLSAQRGHARIGAHGAVERNTDTEAHPSLRRAGWVFLCGVSIAQAV
jgi:hypothetical protein